MNYGVAVGYGTQSLAAIEKLQQKLSITVFSSLPSLFIVLYVFTDLKWKTQAIS